MVESDTIDIDVRMEEVEDEEDAPFQATVDVLVADPGGQPLPEAAITVTGEGGYRTEKPAKDHGLSQSFTNVPLPATVEVEASGYKPVSIDVDESDAGSTVRHNW
jgi:hypothetical protein